MVVENIERIRKMKKVSQEELATAAGMSHQNYNNGVKQRKDFWASDLIKMANHLKVPVSTFFDKDDKENSDECIEIKQQLQFYKTQYEADRNTIAALNLAVESLTTQLSRVTKKV
jgi:transcriptional regulator with XRE-family HTH domain